MTDFDICAGTGDYPTNELSSESKNHKRLKSNNKPPKKGYIMDSTGSWYDPTNYIDCYYADW